MNSSGIDSLLKVTQSPAKPAATGISREGGFEKHLRVAAAPQSAERNASSKEKNSTAGPPDHKAGIASDQEQGSLAHSEQESVEEVEGGLTADLAEEEILIVEPDEVSLSIAAIAWEQSEPIVVTPAVPTDEIVVAVDVGLQEPELANAPVLNEPEKLAEIAPTASETAESAVLSSKLADESSLVQSSDSALFNDKQNLPLEEVTQSVQQPLQSVSIETIQVTVGQAPAKEQVDTLKQTASNEPEKTEAQEQQNELPAVHEVALAIEKVETQKIKLASREENESPSPVPSAPSTSSVDGFQHRTGPTAQHAESNAADRQGSEPQMPLIDRTRFVQRVADAFRSAHRDDGHIQLRLSPPELGSLKIEIAVRHGVLTANLETETADARRVLLDNLPALRQRLADQDIRIEKFEVDIRREGGQSDGQAGAQERQAQQESRRAEMQNRIRTGQAEGMVTRVPRPTITAKDANLDVRV